MSQLETTDTNATADAHDGTVAYVPPLQRTEGQPEPIAAHGYDQSINLLVPPLGFVLLKRA